MRGEAQDAWRLKVGDSSIEDQGRRPKGPALDLRPQWVDTLGRWEVGGEAPARDYS